VANARYGLALGLLVVALTSQGGAGTGAAPLPQAMAMVVDGRTSAPRPEMGPTLSLSPWRQGAAGIPAREFLYFIPLISPEPVEYHASSTNSQQARLVSIERTPTSNGGFTLCCFFELVGSGFSEHDIDHGDIVRRSAERLRAGGRLSHVLGSIRLQGEGKAVLRAEGRFENGTPVVQTVAMAFSGADGTSPVHIELRALSGPPEAWVAQPEALAEVAVLRFVRTAAPARMEVTLAALHDPNARDTAVQRLKGLLKGVVANAFLPPVDIDATGNLAILDFAAALAAGAPTFTFPAATKLRTGTIVGARAEAASAPGSGGG